MADTGILLRPPGDGSVIPPDGVVVDWDGGPPPPRDFGPRPPPEGGVRDGGPGPMRGQEGEQCFSTLGPNDTIFRQDDCEPGLLCVPWDLIAGQQGNVTFPVHSCVRPCFADDECGPRRQCTGNFGFERSSGAERICTDRTAQFDQFCGGSRLFQSAIPGVGRETPGEIVGCPGDTECVIGVFGELNPDDGACLDLCTDQGDCGGATPYCNPLFGQNTGVCSVGRLGQGSFCGTDDPTKLGLTTQCDAAFDSPVSPERGGCVGTNLFDGIGFCAQFCGTGSPCIGVDDVGPYTCEVFDPQDPMFGGICNSDCTNFPENCDGPGATGLGRFCFADRLSAGNITLRFCMDRLPPTLATTFFTPDGQGVSIQGDNCESDMLSFARCSEADRASCLTAGQAQGLCITGCAYAGSPSGCEIVSNTSTCAPVFDPMAPEIGVCSD